MPLQTSKAFKAEAPKLIDYLDAEVMTQFALKKAMSCRVQAERLVTEGSSKKKAPPNPEPVIPKPNTHEPPHSFCIDLFPFCTSKTLF